MRLREISLLALLVCAAGCGDGSNNAQPDASDVGGQTTGSTQTSSTQSNGTGGATAAQSGSGGNSAVGTGGALNTAGGAAATGGANATGGTQAATSATGGQASTGGIAAMGGSSTAAATTTLGGTSTGTQPTTLLGGTAGIGGNSTVISVTGGASTAGGNAGVGGVSAGATGGVETGGINATGGAQAMGGVAATGGTVATGGVVASGGSATGGTGSSSTAGNDSGGVVGTGGTAATGGTSSSTCPSGIEVNGVCWTCEPSAYDANDRVCDCGCGIHDPDCDDLVGNAPNPYCSDSTLIDCCTTFTRQGSCVPVDNVAPMDALDWNDNSKCMYVPAGWTCDPLNYADSICHCGCGVFDEADCAGTSSNGYVCQVWDTPGACSTNSDIDALVSDDNAVCNPDVPGRWTCDRALYGDGTCDCGCGTKDVDCTSLGASVCERCDGKGSCAQPHQLGCGAISESNNALCTGAAWTCSLAEPGDGFCDCGCGMQDPDCVLPVHSRAECSRCGMRGSCAKTCEDIDTSDISTCRNQG